MTRWAYGTSGEPKQTGWWPDSEGDPLRLALIHTIAFDLDCETPTDPGTWTVAGQPATAHQVAAISTASSDTWQAAQTLIDLDVAHAISEERRARVEVLRHTIRQAFDDE